MKIGVIAQFVEETLLVASNMPWKVSWSAAWRRSITTRQGACRVGATHASAARCCSQPNDVVRLDELEADLLATGFMPSRKGGSVKSRDSTSP